MSVESVGTKRLEEQEVGNNFNIDQKLEELGVIDQKESVINQFQNIENKFGEDGTKLAEIFLSNIDNLEKLDYIQGFINHINKYT